MKKKSISQLKKLADAVFSRWLRETQRRADGWVRCYTCGAINPIEVMQAGHYVSRSINQLRYDERNVKVQCRSCNIFKHGAMDEFALELQKEYGLDILKILAKEKRKLKQWKIKELEEIISKYKG